MAGYRATPMQFQFLAVSGRAAGDASIRDQPPVKSCASPGSPRNETHSYPLAFHLSVSLSISHSLGLSFNVSRFPLSQYRSSSSLLSYSLAYLAAVNRPPKFPGISVFRWTSAPPFAVSTVLMRQMRGIRGSWVSRPKELDASIQANLLSWLWLFAREDTRCDDGKDDQSRETPC